MRPRHGAELARSIEPHGLVPQRSKVTEIAAGSATEVQNPMRRVTLYGIEERGVILADIVVSRTAPEGSRDPFVIRNRRLAEAPDLFHIVWFPVAAHRPSILPSL